MLTFNQILEWNHHPVTVSYKTYLQDYLEQLNHAILSGKYLNDITTLSRMIGLADGISQIINLDLKETLIDKIGE